MGASDPWQLWVCQNPIGRAAEAEPRPAPAHVDTPQRDRRSVGLYRPTRYLRRAQRHIPAHSLHAKLKKPSRKAPPAQGPVAATRWTPGEGRGRRKRAPPAKTSLGALRPLTTHVAPPGPRQAAQSHYSTRGTRRSRSDVQRVRRGSARTRFAKRKPVT